MAVPGRRRVAITGVGVVSCCGIGKDAFFDGLCSAAPEGEHRVHDFDPSPWLDVKQARRADKFQQFSVASAQMALDDAGELRVDPARAGVIFGTGVGGLEPLQQQITVLVEKGPRRVSPFLVPMIMGNAGAAAISMRFGWRGPCETVVTACAAGTQSIGNAARLIQSGRCDAVITGGAEAAMAEIGIAAFSNMTALSTSGVSRPFDRRRDGFVIAEGGGALVLEELDMALERGAHVYAEVLGSASTADAHHITAPAPGGAGATEGRCRWANGEPVRGRRSVCMLVSCDAFTLCGAGFGVGVGGVRRGAGAAAAGWSDAGTLFVDDYAGSGEGAVCGERAH